MARRRPRKPATIPVLRFPAPDPPCRTCGRPTRSEATVCARCLRARWQAGDPWPCRSRSASEQTRLYRPLSEGYPATTKKEA